MISDNAQASLVQREVSASADGGIDLPLSEQLKQIKYLYVEKSDMEKTFIITYKLPSPRGEGVSFELTDEVARQIKIKAPSKYRAKQIFYLIYPKYQILKIEEKTNERN